MHTHTHVLQALGKKPRPAWVLRVVNDDPDAEKAHFSTPPRAASPAGAKSPAAASPAGSPAASTPSVLFWIVEWDKESRVAKRAVGPIEGKKKVKWEYATGLIKTGLDSDLAKAKFKNGDVHRIPGVTVRHAKNLDLSGGKPTVDIPWQSEHCISHHKLHVARKPNRGTLMVLYEQGKIACSVRVALFDMLTEEAPEAFEKSAALMTELGVMYADDKCQRDCIHPVHQKKTKQKTTNKKQQTQNKKQTNKENDCRRKSKTNK